jgi:serine/threonine-protein kinase
VGVSEPVSPNEWQRLESLLDALLDAAPDARATLLDQLSADDPGRRAELERLVAECERQYRFFDRPAVEQFSGLLGEDAPSMPETIGDRYRIERELGRGGMATVYLAHDLKHQRHVAVKVLHSAVSGIIGADRFEREIQLAAQLTHPNILPLFDSGEFAIDGDTGRRLWYAMPYIAGESLRNRLVRERQLPVADAVRIAADVADALDYAHRQGFIHRDIKPENILLHDGHALVADFGIARAIGSEDGSNVTEAGILLGTPTYMSPEQASGSRQLDARTDVYALGCVLHEMLAGSAPYTGASAVEILAQVVSSEPRRVSLTRPTAAALDPLVAGAMARMPADRFANARQFADALTTFLALESSGAQVLADDGAMAHPVRARAQSQSRWIRLAPWYGVAAIILAGVAFLRPARSPADPIPRIAVLPLKNLSGTPHDDALAEALTVELISMLGREPDKLRAIASTSVFRFQDRPSDIRAIAESLGVPNVVEGTLTRADNQVRLVLRLVDASDGSSRWTETYTRENSDILKDPERIAREVARQLNIDLNPTAGANLVAGSRGDSVTDRRMAAVDIYTEGRRNALFRTSAGRQEAMDFYRRAIEADSTYAQAVATAAIMLTMRDRHIEGTHREQMALAETMSLKAIALDSLLPEALFARARILTASYRFQEAEALLKRAVARGPTQTPLHEYLAQVYGFMGRPRDALTEAQRAVEDDPHSPTAIAELARAWLVNGDCDKSLAVGERLRRMQPPPARAVNIAAQCYGRRGNWQRAVDIMRPMVAANPEATPAFGFMLGRAGFTREATAIRDTLLAQANRGVVDSYAVAFVHAGLGEFDRAFEWLEKSIDDRSLGFTIMEPIFAELRRDPRFAALRARLGIGKR